MRLLILGGSGFLSGTLAREALALGHEVTILTRGQRPVPNNTSVIQADRKDRSAFTSALTNEKNWDLVVDSIGFDAEDAHQDLAVFSGRCGRFAFISTDFVYDPLRRKVPQSEEDAFYLSDGYGGDKRRAEEIFLQAGTATLSWTIFRPSHIYGPGSQLGCLPLHGRDPLLIGRFKKSEPLRLIGGGRFLQHPVFAPDLARSILSLHHNDQAAGKIFNIANPDIVESRHYYEIIADILGVPAFFEDIPTEAFLQEQPDKTPFCCDRVYDLSLLKASGLEMPATSIRGGLHRHVHFLMEQASG